jgi:protein tyrosine/serine phosphatase
MPQFCQKVLKELSSHKYLLIITITVICIITLWEDVIKDKIFPNNFGIVEQGKIYRSGQIDSFLLEKTLLKYNIKKIIALSGDTTTNKHKVAEKLLAAKLGIQRLVFPMPGNGISDVNRYADVIKEISLAYKEQKPILIHCDRGAQRTGGIIAAYQLIVQQKDIDAVRHELKRYGFKISKNAKLAEFLDKNMIKIAARLKQLGVIDKVPDSIPAIKS